MDDIAALLQAAFADELAEHLAGMRTALAAQAAGGTVDLREFFRRAHSLKGAARAVEQPETEALAHRLESVLEAMMRGERSMDAAALPELHAAIDAIEDAAGGGAAPLPQPTDATPADETVRVSERHVERLTRSLHGLASGVQSQAAVADGLAALDDALQALTAAMGRGARIEAERRLMHVTLAASRVRRAQARSRWELDRAVAELEADAERIMLVPVATLFDGYERMVREVADGQDKTALLQVDAGATTADRRVLQALREPVLHILRNAVGHGIEPPAARIAAGKPVQGTVHATARTARGRLTLTIADDGAGLDDDAIALRARAAGLIAAGAPAPQGGPLHALLFEQGFSTAQAVDALSGRGVGLWVVADAARRLQGHVAIAPRAGGGTVLTLDVPLMTARQAVMLFECGGAIYGLPAAAVARVMRLDDDAIVRAAAGAVVVIDAVPVPVVSLAAVLGVAGADAGAASGARAAVLLHGGTLLLVDALVAVLSAAVGDPGAIAAAAPLVAGTLLLDDGRVALLLAADAVIAAAGRTAAQPALPPPDPIRQRTILVVDDSITTRTLERGILEAAGYAVRLSVDGLAGLERLRAEPGEIDLVVADVEMPRMDGFGLLAAIRNDPALRGIPVVMMTSRSSPDDIERGLELGANAYCIKQEFEQGMLLSVIGQLI